MSEYRQWMSPGTSEFKQWMGLGMSKYIHREWEPKWVNIKNEWFQK